MRQISRKLVRAVTKEGDQASAVNAWLAAQGAGRLATAYVRARMIIEILLNLTYPYIYIISFHCSATQLLKQSKLVGYATRW
jgi:hypothetical protein